MPMFLESGHSLRETRSSLPYVLVILTTMKRTSTCTIMQQVVLGLMLRSTWSFVISNDIHRSTTTTTLCDSVTSTAQTDETATIQRLFQTLFQGDFDNYNQVLQDREDGYLTPREGGQHEHIHCTLVPITETSRLAAFYFEGQPQRIFRFRYYELQPDCCMKLYTVAPHIFQKLQAEVGGRWKSIFHRALQNDRSILTELPKCDIAWSVARDAVQHAYLDDDHDDADTECMHAIMVHGQAIVESQMMPGQKIKILDQLSLYDDVFYINDRGFNPETNEYIYGNQRSVPYRLERVAKWKGGDADEDNDADDSVVTMVGRDVVNESLAWTLGDAHRTPEEYKSKIDEIGGPMKRR